MSETYQYQKMPWYPHMKPADVVIWERFIKAYPDAYDWCQYDVPVGSPPPFGTIVNPATGGDAELLYKKKIDVLATRDDMLDIIELKPRATAASLGQVKSYQALFMRDYSPATEPRAIVVTDQSNPDLEHVAKELGVTVIVV